MYIAKQATADSGYDDDGVPRCILSHLKTCSVNNYGGSETEFEFVRYIM